MRRQGFPASTNQDQIYSLAGAGLDSEDDHIIQIGLRDNNKIGCDVRETISYVLFSPDPKRLLASEANKNLDIFQFDYYCYRIFWYCCLVQSLDILLAS